ncbi:hypothetical protein D9M73_259220 [compost metagenome]
MRAGDGRARGGELRAKDDLFAHAGEGVVVARLLPAEVVVVAFALDAHQQELTIIGGALIMIVMLQQFEGVAGFHRPAVTGAVETLALEFKRFDSQTQQRFAFVVGAVGVLAREIIDFEVVDVALLVQALHGDR